MFVTFEGPEGAGKSTAIRGLQVRLEAEGFPVLATREPGAGSFGAKVRALLLDGDELPPASELFLFLADRAHHVERIIRPALEHGTIVLCDRHADSTLVYQSYARGLDREFVRAGNAFATSGLLPDVTYLLDLEVEVGLSRITQPDRLDREPIAFHRKVREGFLAEASREPGRWVVIDATLPPDELLGRIHADLSSRLG